VSVFSFSLMPVFIFIPTSIVSLLIECFGNFEWGTVMPQLCQ